MNEQTSKSIVEIIDRLRELRHQWQKVQKTDLAEMYYAFQGVGNTKPDDPKNFQFDNLLTQLESSPSKPKLQQLYENILKAAEGELDDASFWALDFKVAEVIEQLSNLLEPTLVKEQQPTDLITLTVAMKRHHVSRVTLLRSIKSGKLKSYRTVKNALHMVTYSSVEKVWRCL